jgi:hypothetical protein
VLPRCILFLRRKSVATRDLLRALDLLQAGDWHGAHAIAQADPSDLGSWCHGIVHMVEPDQSNSRYWYRQRARFLITKSGKPTAVLLGVTDFDDILEELDPEFQQSLTAAAKEYRTGKAVSLGDYLKSRLSARRAG